MWKKIAFLFSILFIIIIIIPLILNEFFMETNNDDSFVITVYNHLTGEILSMELEEYLKGVVAAEMPAAYHQEALKAPAVAARTYAIRQMAKFGGSGQQKYNGADLSTDYNDCQAYISEEEMKEKWGFVSFFYYWAKINKAVEETEGEILVQGNRPIEAVYHANSGGITEAAEYVWGNYSSYLQSVESPFDSLGARNFQKEYKFELDQLLDLFQIDRSKANFEIAITKRSSSGRILEMKVADRTYTGSEVRSILGLSSSKFEITSNGNGIELNTYGYGHGVGMSQDGADGLANNGYKYQDILHHYYTDVEIVYINDLL
ncbi:MAG: stage II sporulation protein D [bacterium]